MENITEKFLSVSNGYGHGDGDGFGFGDGDGPGFDFCHSDGFSDGNGSGAGCRSGNGYSSGYGFGYGSGEGTGGDTDVDGITMFRGDKVYMIDGLATIIDHVAGNVATGRIIERDLTTHDCWIAKVGNCFAHGNTAQEAIADATSKYKRSLPVEERIANFLDCHKADGTKYPSKDLFEWHNILTGSCELGRKQFCKEHGIDLEQDEFSVQEFVALTAGSYGKEVIKQLKEKI